MARTCSLFFRFLKARNRHFHKRAHALLELKGLREHDSLLYLPLAQADARLCDTRTRVISSADSPCIKRTCNTVIPRLLSHHCGNYRKPARISLSQQRRRAATLGPGMTTKVRSTISSHSHAHSTLTLTQLHISSYVQRTRVNLYNSVSLAGSTSLELAINSMSGCSDPLAAGHPIACTNSSSSRAPIRCHQMRSISGRSACWGSLWGRVPIPCIHDTGFLASHGLPRA